MAGIGTAAYLVGVLLRSYRELLGPLGYTALGVGCSSMSTVVGTVLFLLVDSRAFLVLRKASQRK